MEIKFNGVFWLRRDTELILEKKLLILIFLS